MKKLLFATDLDGTLLNARHETDDTIIEGMKKLAETEALVVPATGRSFSMCEMLGFPEGPRVLMNGAIATDSEGVIIHDMPLSRETVKELMETFPNLPFEFCTSDGNLSMQSREETIANFRRRWAKRGKPRREADFDRMFRGHRNDLSKDEILSHTIYKINCNKEDTADCRNLDAWLEAHPSVINTPSDLVLYEITSADATKGKAVEVLADHLGIPHDQVAVFGDGVNDLSMFETFEHSYAPDTGGPEAKAAASELLDGSDEHCVIEKMKELRQTWQ